jgi:NAD(P)-dependent dehydrogenase (short-subunit alcohol dehydrogenase family)
MKTIVITGASSGIGFALAQAYLERGDNVVGNARTMDRLLSAAAHFKDASRFLPVAGDIADPRTAERIFEAAIARFGYVDVLVNNAGVFIPKPMADYTEVDVNAIVGTNLNGFFYPAQQAARHMAGRGAGHIINITTSLARQPLAKVPSVLPILVKGGINEATRALALELAPKGVWVNAVSPGMIDTPLHDGKEGTRAFLRTLAPSGKLGEVRDIVDAVQYLGDARFVTGIILPVDGGATAGAW